MGGMARGGLTGAGKSALFTGVFFMKPISMRLPRTGALLGLACGLAGLASAQNLTLRIGCYNIEDDISGATTPLPGLIYPASGSTATTNGGVLEGIGEEVLSDGVARPIDILALQETTSNPTTVAPIVAGLNAFYSVSNPLASNMYAMSSYQATESGGDVADGNGPNALVYNTQTVQLLASVPVDPAGGTSALGSSSGEYREVMRYEFAPANEIATQSSEFYVYVSHYKSGTSSADLTDREEEAVIIRNDETNLPANARVIYTGDYNVSTSSEASYQTIAAVDSPGGVAQGQGVDPFNTNGATGISWTGNSLLSEKTESATSLHYRDDFEMSTGNIFYRASNGLALVAGTYHVFGNNGTTAYETSVDSGSDTALSSDLAAGSRISASQLYLDLTGASDHLPVVADYTIPVPPPATGFTYSVATSGVAPLTINFLSVPVSGIVTNWAWNFGDGATSNTSTTLSVAHTYTNAGVYSVTETVTGPGGSGSDTATNVITVLTAFQAWQMEYFGCTGCPQAQSNADYDGTGQNNYFKYVAGLNPTNAASIFAFNIASVSNQATWKNLVYGPVAAGRAYTPLFSSAPNGVWAALTTTATPPLTNGTQVTLTDTNAVQGQKFYEMEITLP